VHAAVTAGGSHCKWVDERHMMLVHIFQLALNILYKKRAFAQFAKPTYIEKTTSGYFAIALYA